MCFCKTKDNLQLNVSVGSCHSTVPILWLGLAMKNTWLRSTKHCGLAENTCFGRHRDGLTSRDEASSVATTTI